VHTRLGPPGQTSIAQINSTVSTEFQQSLEVLRRAVPGKDAAVFELMGRNYYGLGDFKKATEVLEKAAALEPENSEV
jgi:Flp pilus assembly protein TadD